ncbi:MAG: hypothetical protein AAFX93_08055 [Verrucomicrobiota bacterium]
MTSVKTVAFALSILVASLLPANAEYRTFTNPNGAEIEAEIVAADASKLSIRLRDGRVYKDLDYDQFSISDQKYIREWVKKEKAKFDNADMHSDADISINFLRGKDEALNDYDDIDDRIVKFDPEVVITSDELEITYPDVKGTLVVIGKGVINKKQFAILSSQDFQLKAEPRSKTRWQGMKFECRYDPDYGGFEYGGYLIVVRNRAGEIVMAKGSKSSWENFPDRVLNARKLTGYNSNFTEESKLYTTFGLPR